MTKNLPQEYIEHYKKHEQTIKTRLDEFKNVPRKKFILELCYCLLTPQSRALHAEMVIQKMVSFGFPNKLFDPTPILRNPEHYIRFHNVKSERIISVWKNWHAIDSVICDEKLSEQNKREWLIKNVNGMSYKESSHFLRNIGMFQLAIIDRHILKHLFACKAIDEIPKSVSAKKYLEIEQKFKNLASKVGLGLQELDLLFWSYEEGSVRK